MTAIGPLEGEVSQGTMETQPQCQRWKLTGFDKQTVSVFTQYAQARLSDATNIFKSLKEQLM